MKKQPWTFESIGTEAKDPLLLSRGSSDSLPDAQKELPVDRRASHEQEGGVGNVATQKFSSSKTARKSFECRLGFAHNTRSYSVGHVLQ